MYNLTNCRVTQIEIVRGEGSIMSDTRQFVSLTELKKISKNTKANFRVYFLPKKGYENTRGYSVIGGDVTLITDIVKIKVKKKSAKKSVSTAWDFFAAEDLKEMGFKG
tara:strand:- start:219 stop:542 length:324 start_codon:yes stop_codon:yes gene_type:complete